MLQNEFKPIVLRLNLKAQKPLQIEEWAEMVRIFMNRYVGFIVDHEEIIIGHIKGITSFKDGGYIQMNCTCRETGIVIEQQGTPQPCCTIEVVLNTLATDIDTAMVYAALQSAWLSHAYQQEILLKISDISSGSIEEVCPVCGGLHHENHEHHNHHEHHGHHCCER